MGAVAGEQHAALVEGLGHALMHGVERVIGNFVIAALLMDALQAALDALHAQRFFVGFRFRHRKHAAPDSGRAVALDLEQVEPLVGIEEIIARAIALAGGAEIEAGADLDEALRPGETFESEFRRGAAPRCCRRRRRSDICRAAFRFRRRALVTVASTSSAVCVRPMSLAEKRTSPRPLALMWGSAACTSLYCSHCTTYG